MSKRLKKLIPDFFLTINRKGETRRIIANTSWLLFDQIVRMGLGLFVGIWLARYLGPENLGHWSFATAYVAILAVVAKLGLDNMAIKELVASPFLNEEVLGTSFVIKIVGSCLAFIIGVLLIIFFKIDDDITFYLILIICFSLIFHPLDVIDLFFQSKLLSKYTVLAKNTSFLIFSFLKVVLILKEASLYAFGFVFLGEVILSSILLSVLYITKGYKFKTWSVNKKLAKNLIKNSLPLLFAGVSVVIFMRIDQIMLGTMTSATALGNYTSAVRLSEAWYFVPTIIVGSAFPSIIKARKYSYEIYLKKLQNLNDLMTWLSIGIALVVAPLANFIVYYLFGAEFSTAGSVLAIHIWAGVFAFIGVSSNRHLMVEDLTKIILYKTSIGAVANIGLNFIFIPHFEAIGAAVATLISQAISVSFSNLLFKESRLVLLIQLRSFNLVRIIRGS